MALSDVVTTYTKDLPGFRLQLGPLVITWRSLFVARKRYPARSLTGESPPLFERPTVQEDEEPYRKGHARIIRLWPTKWALIFGWWGDPVVSDDMGPGRALTELLASPNGVASGQPVTSLLGSMSPEELAEHVAAHVTAGPNVPDDFQIIDMRDGKAL